MSNAGWKKREPIDVVTRKDLCEFVAFLSEDSRNGEWENDSLPTFFSAMSAWIEDMDGYYQNQGKTVPQEPTWQTIASILYAATMYE